MNFQDWGEVSYAEACVRQLKTVDAVAKGDMESTLVHCTHPPVVTTGRGTKPGDVHSWSGEIHETTRGGRATYHGPSQIVVYPIVNLAERKDLHKYLRNVEQAIIETLKEFGIQAEAKTIEQEDGPSLTGVWVEDKKIASIGIAVKKWVTYHGLALNVSKDPRAFSGINPCGFLSNIMTSMEEVLGQNVQKSRVLKTLVSRLEARLGS